MQWEVEMKFPVSELDELAGRLETLGAVFASPTCQVDQYYGHPARDFAETDEALRIRQTDQGVWITYKGPNLDSATKTRREIELRLGDEEPFDSVSGMLQALSFVPVATVTKSRREATLCYQSQQIKVALDEVEQLGQFVEFEVISNQDQFDSARTALLSLTGSLGLGNSERRSYLELLLASKTGGAV